MINHKKNRISALVFCAFLHTHDTNLNEQYNTVKTIVKPLENKFRYRSTTYYVSYLRLKIKILTATMSNVSEVISDVFLVIFCFIHFT